MPTLETPYIHDEIIFDSGEKHKLKIRIEHYASLYLFLRKLLCHEPGCVDKIKEASFKATQFKIAVLTLPKTMEDIYYLCPLFPTRHPIL